MAINNKKNKKDKDKEITSPYSITENPENFLFIGGIILFWFYWYHDVIVTWWKNPTLKLLHWCAIGILIIIMIIGAWSYTVLFLRDVFLRPENLTKEALTRRALILAKWSIVFYGYAIIGPSMSLLVRLLFIFFLYHCIERIYTRIYKRIDFIKESTEQRFQTRSNNRFWLWIPLLYLLTWCIPKWAAYMLVTLYLLAWLGWYNNWPNPEMEEYTVTKAPVGSEERFELLKDALGFTEDYEESILDDPYAGEWQSNIDEYDYMEHGRIAPDSEYADDPWNPTCTEYTEYTMEQEDLHELKIEMKKKRDRLIYDEYELSPTHEYYLWWLMKDVPFYFTIKAFNQMFLDILSWLLRLFLLPPLLFLTLFSYFMPFGAPIYNQIFWAFIILFLCLIIPMGWLGLSSIHVCYSEHLFFERKEAYGLFDDVHPYAVRGPTIDGPRNWQYWFYIFFSYFPGRASIIFQQQLFEEEIRLAELALEMDMEFMDLVDGESDEEAPFKTDIWNPIDLYLLRKAAPDEVQRYKQRIKEQEQYQVKQEVIDYWMATKNYRPQWWRHYYI